MTILDDKELLGRVVKGDEAAFMTLYDRHANRVYALALRILQDPMMAEEATQDTFLKLWGRARQFLSERGTVLVWIMTIAHRTALDRLRLEARRPILSDGIDPEELWKSIPETTSSTDENRWHSLAMVVQDLPEEHRRVIELAYYQGLSQSEIAEVLGWPLGTVKTRLRSAMAQLRSAWEES